MGVIAPFPIKVAREPHKGGKGPCILHTIGVVDCRAGAGHQGGGLGGGVQAGCLDDQAGRNTCDFLSLAGRKTLDIGMVFVKSRCPLLHKVPVIESLFYDHVGHGQGQGTGGPGSHSKVDVRMGCHGSDQGTHFNDLQPLLPRLNKAADGGRIGIERICTPDEKTLGVFNIGPRKGAVIEFECQHHCRKAGAGFGGEVGGTEGMGQALQEWPHPLGIPGKKSHRFRAMFCLDNVQALCNVVQGLIPGYGLEFPGPPLPRSYKGREDPVFVVDILPAGRPF